MASTRHVELSTHELDELAWNFLGSEFTTRYHLDWPIDQCVDAYLRHHDLTDVANDGVAYNALLDRVMANIPPAIRTGLLAPPQVVVRPETARSRPRKPRGVGVAGFKLRP